MTLIRQKNVSKLDFRSFLFRYLSKKFRPCQIMNGKLTVYSILWHNDYIKMQLPPDFFVKKNEFLVFLRHILNMAFCLVEFGSLNVDRK